MTTHDSLRAAAAGIGAISERDMDRRLSPPKQRLRSRTSLDQVRDQAKLDSDEVDEADGGCPAGGLTVVMHIPLDQATTHFSVCLSCQEQFIRWSGLPAMESQAMTRIDVRRQTGRF